MSILKLCLGVLIAASSLQWLAACTDDGAKQLRKQRSRQRADASQARDAGEPDSGRQAQPAALTRLVGAVDDSDIRLGVIADRELTRARVFFCGGPDAYETGTRWVLTELAADGGLDYAADGWQVRGRLTNDSLSGTLERDSEPRREFSAAKLQRGTLEGLYEGTAECGRVGLIVTQAAPDEEASGQGACVGGGHLPQQVNPDLPISLVGDQIQVTVGDDTASVRAADLTPL